MNELLLYKSPIRAAQNKQRGRIKILMDFQMVFWHFGIHNLIRQKSTLLDLGKTLPYLTYPDLT